MADLTVAQTILQQLGGRRFTIMTGARQFVGGDTLLQFRIPRTNRINKVRIELTPMDTYTIRFYDIRGTQVTERSAHEDIYADDLQDLFTRETGLRTRL